MTTKINNLNLCGKSSTLQGKIAIIITNNIQKAEEDTEHTI